MGHPPASLRWLFWDTDIASIECDRHAAYIINRVSDYGELSDWRWLLNQYGAGKVAETVKSSRLMSRKSANLWSLVLEIPRAEIRCLKKSSPSRAANF